MIFVSMSTRNCVIAFAHTTQPCDILHCIVTAPVAQSAVTLSVFSELRPITMLHMYICMYHNPLLWPTGCGPCTDCLPTPLTTLHKLTNVLVMYTPPGSVLVPASSETPLAWFNGHRDERYDSSEYPWSPYCRYIHVHNCYNGCSMRVDRKWFVLMLSSHNIAKETSI